MANPSASSCREYVVHSILSGSSEELLVCNYVWPEYCHYVSETHLVWKVDRYVKSRSIIR